MALITWIEGARPKTLIASLSPVIIGSLVATQSVTRFSWPLFFAVLTFALCIQIGTNYANDYYDFMKGSDTSSRKGPRRLLQGGLASPSSVKKAFLLMFSLSFLIAAALVVATSGISILLAVISIFFGIYYTAGKYGLAYIGLGEVFVILFFGIVATCGSEFVQTGSVSPLGILASFGPGLLSTAIIVVNNLRDIEEDSASKKQTLAVRFGSVFAKNEYILCIGIASFVPILCLFYTPERPFILLASLIALPSIPLIKAVASDANGEKLNGVLAKTGMILILYTALFTLGWFV